MENQELPKVRVVTSQDEFIQKHPALFLILTGFGVIGIGILLSFILIGIPMVFIGALMVLFGFLHILLSLIAKIFPFIPKPSDKTLNKITSKTKKFGLLFPKFMRSKEMQDK